MYTVRLEIEDSLRFFLDQALRGGPFDFTFPGKRSLKDLVESLGIPHVEIGGATVNGSPAQLSHIVAHGDVIALAPCAPVSLRPEEARFVLDVHLRKLARRLRLLGFDANHREGRDDETLAATSASEGRILLTRDRGLLKRRMVTRAMCVRSTNSDAQLAQVIARFSLGPIIAPFRRCIECNGPIAPVECGPARMDALRESVPPGVLSWCDEYFECSACRKVYWKGSHYEKLLRIVRAAVEDR